MAGPRKGQGNAVAQAIDKVGGLTKATFVAQVAAQTLLRWRKAGKITKADAAVRLAEASGIPVRKLVGVE